MSRNCSLTPQRWRWRCLPVGPYRRRETTDTRPGIFDPAFRTMMIYEGDNRLGFPIMNLGSSDRITLTFDELAEDRRYLRYRLIHCNADWTPSQLVESEYIDGFNIADIEDYALSQATTVHYVNYRLSIPNRDMSPHAVGQLPDPGLRRE